MAITKVWSPPEHEELSILPEETALSVARESLATRTFKSALEVADHLGSLAGAGIGLVAGLVNAGTGLVDSFYERRR